MQHSALCTLHLHHDLQFAFTTLDFYAGDTHTYHGEPSSSFVVREDGEPVLMIDAVSATYFTIRCISLVLLEAEIPAQLLTCLRNLLAIRPA